MFYSVEKCFFKGKMHFNISFVSSSRLKFWRNLLFYLDCDRIGIWFLKYILWDEMFWKQKTLTIIFRFIRKKSFTLFLVVKIIRFLFSKK